VARVEFKAGHGAVQRLRLDTDTTTIAGTDARPREHGFDTLLTPRRKSDSPLALNRSMGVRGPIIAPAVSLVDTVEMPANSRGAAACSQSRQITVRRSDSARVP